jgi:hypothetical protein
VIHMAVNRFSNRCMGCPAPLSWIGRQDACTFRTFSVVGFRKVAVSSENMGGNMGGKHGDVHHVSLITAVAIRAPLSRFKRDGAPKN